MIRCLHYVFVVTTILGFLSDISAAPTAPCHCADFKDVSSCECSSRFTAKNVRSKKDIAESEYWSDPILSHEEEGEDVIKRSSEVNSVSDANLNSVFRWGKREGQLDTSPTINGLFRLGKRGYVGGEGDAKDDDSENSAHGNVFRWGKRYGDYIPEEYMDSLETSGPVDDQYIKRRFASGKRSDVATEHASPQLFRWGKRGDSAPASVFRWGKRSMEYGNTPVFRWGKREYGDDLSMRLQTILSQWPGKRVVNTPEGDDAYASVFRWGKRSPPSDHALDGGSPNIFRWGKRDVHTQRKLNDNVEENKAS